MKIVSGGQSGVDRAALDVALQRGIDCGGWCPRGRRAEDGIVASRYPLDETPSPRCEQRTRWNVSDADALLVLNWGGAPSPGTCLARKTAQAMGKACLVVDMADADAVERVTGWLQICSPSVVNIAGPRESECPGIYQRCFELLGAVLDDLEESQP